MSDGVGQQPPPQSQVKMEGVVVEAALSMDMGLMMERLEILIRGGDLQSLTIKGILQQLAKEFNVSFEKKERQLLKQRIHEILADIHQSDEDEPEEQVETRPRKRQKAATARSSTRKSTKKRAAKSDGKPKTSALFRPLKLSAALAEFVGNERMARTEVVRFLFAYVKEHELQNPEDRREILCDDALKKLLGFERVTFFSMNKYLSPHFEKMEKKPDVPRAKAKRNAFNDGKQLSPALQDVLGISTLSRPQVVKQLWVYIKKHELQDPSNRKVIVCDPKLQQLFGVERINMFAMNKALSEHLTAVPALPQNEDIATGFAPPVVASNAKTDGQLT